MRNDAFPHLEGALRVILISQLRTASIVAGYGFAAAAGGAMVLQQAPAPEVPSPPIQHTLTHAHEESPDLPPPGGDGLVVGDSPIEEIINRHLLPASRPARHRIRHPRSRTRLPGIGSDAYRSWLSSVRAGTTTGSRRRKQSEAT
jgi:hypothetical protein